MFENKGEDARNEYFTIDRTGGMERLKGTRVKGVGK